MRLPILPRSVPARSLLRWSCLLLAALLAGPAAASNDTQLLRAGKLLAARQYAEAFQVAQKAPAGGQRALIAGAALLHGGKPEEALPHLAEAERSYPLLADHAAALRAEALFQLKRHREAAAAATAAAKVSPAPHLARRMEKLAADALLESGDCKAAQGAYQQFVTRHSLGRDSVDARFQTARCREQLGDRTGAASDYRALWLQHPASSQAAKAQELLKGLEKAGVANATRFTPDELLQRAALLLAANQPAEAAWTLASIPRQTISDEQLARIELRSGQAAVKQRQYTLAQGFLTRAAGARQQNVRDEARLALARVEERTRQTEKALARLLALASEKGPLADDALLEAGLAHKHAGRFNEAATLLERLVREFPKSDQLSRAAWEMAWSRYLAGELPAAAEGFRQLLKDATYRERAVYWHARTLERQNKSHEAESLYRTLLQEYPFGFYAAWRRETIRQPAGWEPLGPGQVDPALPLGSERIIALIACGMPDEARSEITTLKGKGLDTAAAPGFARLQQLAGDSHGSIVTFHQNRPQTMERGNLPYWAIGFPRPYAELFSKHAAANRLPEALVLTLAKAESHFRPEVKSHAGAIGLMQLMPATAKATARFKGSNYNPLWLIDPEYNIRLGTRHLRELLDQYHQDTVYTLAAYNAGATAVDRWRAAFGQLPRDEFIENIPYHETRDYVKKIVAQSQIYRALYRIP